jgi:hypothetical protein
MLHPPTLLPPTASENANRRAVLQEGDGFCIQPQLKNAAAAEPVYLTPHGGSVERPDALAAEISVPPIRDNLHGERPMVPLLPIVPPIHAVMTPSEIQDLIRENVRFRDWRFLVQGGLSGYLLSIEFQVPHEATGKPVVKRSRKWRMSETITKSELIHTVFMAVMNAMEQEVREQFVYRGRAIFSSSLNVESLHRISTNSMKQ